MSATLSIPQLAILLERPGDDSLEFRRHARVEPGGRRWRVAENPRKDDGRIGT